ncbi:MAG: four helix bundle protein [Patescibacteria group bacterium]
MNDDVFRFRDFNVYKDARVFRRDVTELAKKNFPKEERFELSSQLFRALASILLNIAEGSQKYSDQDFARYLNMALGSLNEVVACLDCALDDGYFSMEEHKAFCDRATSIHKQLKVFIFKVRNTH